MRGKVIFILGNVCLFTLGGGGYLIQPWTGESTQSSLGPGGTWSQVQGVPSVRSGGYPIEPWMGGYPVSGLGGYPVSGLGGTQSQVWGVPSLRGVPGLRSGGSLGVPSKGKNFTHQIRLDTCSDWKKKFSQRDPPPPVKGKMFHTRFGLIHVQTGNKINTRFGLIYVQTEKKNFHTGTPPPSKGKNF